MRRQRNMAQMKEQNKTPEKEQKEMEISSLPDAEFKTLVIRMLQELIGYSKNIKKTQAAMKATLSEIKKNLQGTNSDGKETGTQINDLEQKEEINIQPEQNEETNFQKNEERLGSLWDNFKCSNIRIIRVPEGEKEEQEIEDFFEQIMKENFLNLEKEIVFQEVQEAQGVPKNGTQGETHHGTSSLSLSLIHI